MCIHIYIYIYIYVYIYIYTCIAPKEGVVHLAVPVRPGAELQVPGRGIMIRSSSSSRSSILWLVILLLVVVCSGSMCYGQSAN